jgi:hypothetical protein
MVHHLLNLFVLSLEKAGGLQLHLTILCSSALPPQAFHKCCILLLECSPQCSIVVCIRICTVLEQGGRYLLALAVTLEQTFKLTVGTLGELWGVLSCPSIVRMYKLMYSSCSCLQCFIEA